MSEPELNFFLSSHLPIVMYWLYNLCSCNYFLICVLYNPKGVGLGYIVSLSFLPISLSFLLYVFSCGKSFLLVFMSFSSIMALSSNSFGLPMGGGKLGSLYSATFYMVPFKNV